MSESTPHSAVREYLMIWIALMALLVATVAAAALPIGEPWSFLIALLIAALKAVLVILFFMHVKDASRVVWVFCGASFLWLGIMIVLTFNDYMTREHTPNALRPTPQVTSHRLHVAGTP